MSSSYAPQSPDLSGGHRPQSPDLSSLPSSYSNHNQSGRFTGHFGGGNGYGVPQYPQYPQPTSQPFTSMPDSRYNPEPYNHQYIPNNPYARPLQPQPHIKPEPQFAQFKTEEPFAYHDTPVSFKQEPLPDPTLGCQLKTSFPVARIKRIMQADEDIGKVAQVTPTVVSRALELFMIKLISAAAHQARGPAGSGVAASKGPRRILVQHLKKAVLADKTFDFLETIVDKVPDAPAKTTKKDAGSDSDEAKPRKRSKKRKDSGDEF